MKGGYPGLVDAQDIIQELGFGLVPNLFVEAEPSPEVMRGLWEAFRQIVLRGVLPRSLKEMMGVLVSRRNASPYAAQVHLHALMFQGLEDPLLEALSRGQVPEGLPPKAAALLQFALQARRPYPPGLLQLLEEAGLSPREIREAVAVVGLFEFINAWTDLLKVPIDAL